MPSPGGARYRGRVLTDVLSTAIWASGLLVLGIVLIVAVVAVGLKRMRR